MAAGMPNLSEEQKNRLAQRLSMMSHDRGDGGQGLPRTMRALAPASKPSSMPSCSSV